MELKDFASKLWLEYNGQPCKLYGLPADDGDDVIIETSEGVFDKIRFSELKPIPIIKEFMEKNEFENDDTFSKRHFQNQPMYRMAPHIFLVIFENANVCGVYSWETWFGDRHVQDKFREVIEIKYVHEFQQIMWLIDKNKQIIV